MLIALRFIKNKTMYKRMITAMMAVFAITASMAQTNYRLGRNLNFKEANDRISVNAIVGIGDVATYGGELNYQNGNTFWWGAKAGIAYSSEFQTLSNAAIQGGVRLNFGNIVSIAPSIAVGFGQYARTEYTSSICNNDTFILKSSPWTPMGEGRLEIAISLSPKVELNLLGGYRYNLEEDIETVMAVNWQQDEIEHNNKGIFVGGGLSFLINKNSSKQHGGDLCWVASPYFLYSNMGTGGGIVLDNFNRSGARGGRILGFGSSWTVDDGDISNEIFGKVAYRYLPWGSESAVSFDFGAMVGIGNYSLEASGSTDDIERFSHHHKLSSFGGSAKGLIGIDFRLGRRVSVGIDGFAGYALWSSINGEGTHGYDITYSSETNKFVYGGMAKISFAL